MYFKEVFSHILINILFKIKSRAKRVEKMRKYSILGIQSLGPWPLDPLCHAKINSNCIYKGKEKIVWLSTPLRNSSGILNISPCHLYATVDSCLTIKKLNWSSIYTPVTNELPSIRPMSNWHRPVKRWL